MDSTAHASGVGLGRRAANHDSYDEGELGIWERECRPLFKKPWARAAMLSGGLLARIAAESVPLEPILAGPSSKCFTQKSLYLWDGDSNSSSYRDDKLSADDVHVLIGAFHLALDDGESLPACVHSSPVPGSDTAKLNVPRASPLDPWKLRSTFFPKPQNWKKSSLPGYCWTEDAESWFTKCKVDLVKGAKELRDNWDPAIRFNQRLTQQYRPKIEWFNQAILPLVVELA